MFVNNEIAPGDQRRDRVYENFKSNLNDLLDIANSVGVPVVLSSVASNVKDFAPFASFVPATFNGSDLPSWKKVCALATTYQTERNFSQATKLLEQALLLNPASAEAQFRLGQCQLGLTNLAAARRSLTLARDLDSLPFRADTKLNAIIAEASSARKGQRVAFADAEQALASCSPDGIPGTESFYEHVHLNPEGNYRLALAFAQQTLKWLPKEVTNRQTGEWSTAGVCNERLGLTDWNRYTIYEEIERRLSEPPFTAQLNHSSQMVQLTNVMGQLRLRMTRAAAEQARNLLGSAIKRRPQDHYLHHNLAEFLTNVGNLNGAAEQLRVVCDLLPEHYAAFLQLGRVLARLKKYSEAQAQFETALRLRPDIFDVRVELGKALVAQEKLDAALAQYAEARRTRGEDDSQVLMLEADALARQHKRPEAVRKLQAAVRLRPEFFEAHELLGMELAVDNRFPEAQVQFEQVVALRPDYAEGHLNLGIALARQNRFREALDQFEITLRLDPESRQAKEFISKVRMLQTQPAGQ